MARSTRRLKGSGSVYKSGDRWIVQVERNIVNGRRRYRRWAFRTLADAQRKLRQLQDGSGRHGKPPRVDAVLQAALEAQAKQLRPRTLRSYQRTVDLHIGPYLGHIPIDKLDARAVEAWLRELRTKQRGTATVRYARVVLRTLLRPAQRDGWLTTNPAALASAPKHTKAKIRPLTITEAAPLLAQLSGHWIAPIVTLMLGLGLRLGETLGLHWTDVHLAPGTDTTPASGTVQIRRTLQRVHTPGGKKKTALTVADPKTERSARTLTLPAVLVELLLAHRREYAPIRSKWVFSTLKGTPIEPRNVNRAWDPLRAAAGLPTLRLHDLRHSAATFALVLGIPPRAVADMLGHAETRTTLDTYTHVLPVVRDGIAAQIDTLLRSIRPADK